MLAVAWVTATQRDCLKGHPETGNKIVVMGGDNYESVWVAVLFPLLKQVDTHRESNSMQFNVPMQKCRNVLIM